MTLCDLELITSSTLFSNLYQAVNNICLLTSFPGVLSELVNDWKVLFMYKACISGNI